MFATNKLSVSFQQCSIPTHVSHSFFKLVLPVQLLWLNLVTNGIQHVALAFEPGEGDVLMHRQRSPREPIFNRLMIERTLIGAFVMGGVCFATFYWMLESGQSVSSARNFLLLLMVLFENIHIGNCRSESKSVFYLSLLRSPILLIGTLTAFLIHVLMMHIPLGKILLGTEVVNMQTWVMMITLSLTVLVTMGIHKLIRSMQIQRH